MLFRLTMTILLAKQLYAVLSNIVLYGMDRPNIVLPFGGIMPESAPLKPDQESRGKRKAEMLALQKIGESLMKLTNDQLAKIDLPEDLREAIQQAKLLKSNEAKRRQLQYIGKIMREIDPEAIKQALKRIQYIHERNTTEFHQAENWRAKLIAVGDEALNAFLNEYPATDRQQLRQLLRKAQHDHKTDKNTGAEKALFKYLLTIIETK